MTRTYVHFFMPGIAASAGIAKQIHLIKKDNVIVLTIDILFFKAVCYGERPLSTKIDLPGRR